MPLVSFTRATLRNAEFGFFGVVVYTRVHTPRRCGLPLRAAVFCLATLSVRPLRTSCWIVGMTGFLLARSLFGLLLPRRPNPRSGVSPNFWQPCGIESAQTGFGRNCRRARTGTTTDPTWVGHK